MVGLQFSFSNPDVVPALVKRIGQETAEERYERKNHCSGTLAIEPTENVSLAELLDDLEARGYQLADALYQERLNPNSPRSNETYHMVRFLFTRATDGAPSDDFQMIRSAVHAELRSICTVAMWRVRAFSNPFYLEGREVPGHAYLSINLEARRPLYYPDGQPVTVWQKDKNGKHLGETPLPLHPTHLLRIVDDTVRLVRA